jgi:hypothetical protein
MRTANIIAAISAIAWLVYAMSGMDGVIGVAERVGEPDMIQVKFYVVWPLLVVLGIVGTAWVCNALQRFSRTLGVLSSVSLIVLLPYCALLSGGV